MKKYYWNLATLLMVAVLSVGFVSCSSDDDDNNSGGEGGQQTNNALVGNWYAEDIDEDGVWKDLVVIKSDGTFREQLYEASADGSYTCKHQTVGTYVYDATNKKLVVTVTQVRCTDSDCETKVGDIATFTNVSVSSSTLTYYGPYGDGAAYTKTTSTSLF